MKTKDLYVFSSRMKPAKKILDYDPYWSSVVLLLRGEGPNNSTTLIDSSGKNTVTAVGTGKISTNQFKFGTSSFNSGGGWGNGFITGSNIKNSIPQAFYNGMVDIPYKLELSFWYGKLIARQQWWMGSYSARILEWSGYSSLPCVW
jgi:hypothetical protein